MPLPQTDFPERSGNLAPKRRNYPVSSRISVLFLVSGILSLAFSIYSDSQVLALIGLGLTFWGVLFLLLQPLKLVKGSLLYNSTVSTYTTIDRIVNDLKYKGKGSYIPPYPKDVYLPEYLKGLKDPIVFIPAENGSAMPSIEEIATGKFLSKNPKGVLVAPPGSGILTQIEEKLNVDFTKMELTELCAVLPTFILQDLNLAKEMTLELNGDQAHLKIVDSLFKNLYNVRNNLKSVTLVGCPIASAVACALAKTSGRTVSIQKQELSPDGLAIEVWYNILQR